MGTIRDGIFRSSKIKRKMGIPQVFDDFYEGVPVGTEPALGLLFWVPTHNIGEIPRILDVERATSTEREPSELARELVKDALSASLDT